MFRAFFKALGSLLGGSEPEFAEQRSAGRHLEAHPVAHSETPKSPGKPGGALDDRLAQALVTGEQIVAGSLELIGLEDVRDALGADWLPLADKVIAFAEQEIQRCLDPGDEVRPHGGASFIVYFNDLDKDAAEQQATRMALRIKAALIEEMPEIAGAISIKHFVTGIDPTSLEGSETSLTDALFERLRRLRAEAEQLALRDRKSLVKDFQILFSPVLHVRRQVIIFNRCLSNNTYGGITLSQFKDLADSEDLAAVCAELDYMTLAKSLEALHRHLQQGRRTMLLLPVDVRTLSNPTTAAEYVRLLEAMPEAYRRFIILEISGAGWHHSPSQLGRQASQLAPYSRHVAVELSLDDARVGAVSAEPVWGVTLNLAGADTADPRLMPQLRNFASAASAMAVNSMARGATSIGLALAATNAGFTYVDGPGVHLPIREPKVPTRLRPVPPPTVTRRQGAALQARSRGRRNPAI